MIGSLVYVAMQVRASTAASRVESKLRLTETLVNYGDLLISSPELNDLMIRDRKNIESLSKEEYMQFSNMALKASWYISAGFFMYKEDAISDDDWFEIKVIAKYWCYSPGFRQWWKHRGHLSFTGEFTKFIEGQMEEALKASRQDH